MGLKWHHKTVGPLTYYQARQYFSSLGTELEFPTIKDLRDGITKHPDEFMQDYPYWSRMRCDKTMHAFVVYSDGDTDTMEYGHYAYFRPCYIEKDRKEEKK